MVEVYDIETLSNCFTYTGVDVNTGAVSQFVIHESRNDSELFIEHLKKLKGMIGYNSVSFDYPIIHWFFDVYPKWKESSKIGTLHGFDGEGIARMFYKKAQEIINTPHEERFFVRIPEWKMFCPQLDLFLLNHLDNKAKLTSLKDLEFWMNYPKVQDMPIKHTDEITEDQIEEILEYNLNDVMATLEFYKLCRDSIDLRKAIQRDYKIKCINYNNGKIGEQIILKLYCAATYLDPKEVRKMRTPRASIDLKDCIPPYASFRLKEFQKILDFFKGKTITKTKDAFKEKVLHNNMLIVFGTGGAHGCCTEGIYTSTVNDIIMSHDVASLYPSLAIEGKFYPEHLGPEFYTVYKEGIVEVRLKEKAKGKEANKSIVDGFKQAANIPYGKSNEVNSFLYDPLYTMKTTISGMVALSMLTEAITIAIPECKHLMLNTDGGEVIIPRSKESIYKKVCSDWEKVTGLQLEYAKYDKLVIRDINNYIGVYEGNKKDPKHKGYFEIEKECHKDSSFKVIQIALSKYFIDGVPVEKTIKEHKNIYDFCGRQKFKSDSYGEIHYLAYDGNRAYDKVERQQKTTRYYISNKGSTFVKVFPVKNKSNFIDKGYVVTIFNNYVEKEDYDINYDYYIEECNKVIQIIETKQLTLI